MRIGYARVSTSDQETALQIDALKKADCEIILEEKASGGTLNRPVLQDMLKKLKHGDVVVIYKLDRIARSMRGLLSIAERMEDAGAQLVSLTEALDTTSAVGRMIFQIIGAFGEFEREVIRERTNAGLAAAKSRGSIMGRRSEIEKESSEVLRLWKSGRYTKTELARHFNSHISSVKRLIARHGAQQKRPSAQMEIKEF